MKAGRRTTGLAATLTLIGGSLFASVPTAPASATPIVAISPTVRTRLVSRGAPVSTAQCEQIFRLACYAPDQVQAAYDEGPLLSQGVNGAGQSIAVIDAFGSPTIAYDLARFDRVFHLPAPPQLKIIQPAGRVPPFDPSNPQMVAWASETTLDVDWAHVIAPGARIVLVETPVAETEGSKGFKQIVQAETYVVDHHLAGIISQSFSATEQTLPGGLRFLLPLRASFIDAFFHGVTVLAASGDDGSTEPVNQAGTKLSDNPVTTWPPSDPLVTGVGGTQLHLNASGARTAPDSVWNDGYNRHLDQTFFGNSGPDAAATGGGRSIDFPRPSYQHSVAKVVQTARGVPDISMSAACNGAVDLYESFPGVAAGWYLSCGTSESAPLFAGIVALADQVAGHPLGLINPALYDLSADKAPGISDITSGSNTVSFLNGQSVVTVPGFSARPGYDLASGVGTVNAARFVPELVKAVTGKSPGCDRNGDWQYNDCCNIHGQSVATDCCNILGQDVTADCCHILGQDVTADCCHIHGQSVGNDCFGPRPGRGSSNGQGRDSSTKSGPGPIASRAAALSGIAHPASDRSPQTVQPPLAGGEPSSEAVTAQPSSPGLDATGPGGPIGLMVPGGFYLAPPTVVDQFLRGDSLEIGGF